jgi:hypothetical protein
MEKQLFDWNGWDIQDTMAFTFYNCVLKVDIGPYKAGEVVKSVDLDYGEGQLHIYDDDGNTVYECKLTLKLG